MLSPKSRCINGPKNQSVPLVYTFPTNYLKQANTLNFEEKGLLFRKNTQQLEKRKLTKILKTEVSIILQILSLLFVNLILEEIFICFESKLNISFGSYFFGENRFEVN